MMTVSWFYRILEQFSLDNSSDTYAQIAENIDIETLKKRCPDSFGQFYTDIQAFVGTT
jgi:hypothetical protein